MSPMNNRRMTPMAEPGILDFAPGAAAAYSLRNLSLSYSSPVVTVRRSTDSAEADFTASEVSDGTLAAWCGGGDGFVKQWWDQSGNGRHASQGTAANQPKIVDSGSLVVDEGTPAVRFDETPRYLNAGAVGIADNYTAIALWRTLDNTSPQHNIISTYQSSTGGPDGMQFVELPTTDRFYVSAGNFSGDEVENNVTSYGYAGTTTMMFLHIDAGVAVSSLWRNGALLQTVTASSFSNIAHGDLYIGQVEIYIPSLPARATNGYIKEILIYPTDQTALRTRIEGNIAWYY